MTDLLDSNSLAYSGRALPPAQQARNVRRWGWWYQAEWRLMSMRAYWTSVLGTAVLTPVLYLVAMGVGLGALVDANSGGVAGVPYLTFVGPGLLVSTVVMSASGELTYPVMDGFTWNKVYYARGASPSAAWQVPVGEIVAVAIRFAVEAAFFWVVLVLGGVAGPGSWPMVLVAALAAVAFGAPLMAYSSTLENEGYQFALVQRFGVMPMFLFAGTFFPLESMPLFLQWIGWLSPMWHGTQVARLLAFGLPLPWWMVLVHLGYLVTMLGVGAWLSVRFFSRRLAK